MVPSQLLQSSVQPDCSRLPICESWAMRISPAMKKNDPRHEPEKASCLQRRSCHSSQATKLRTVGTVGNGSPDIHKEARQGATNCQLQRQLEFLRDKPPLHPSKAQGPEMILLLTEAESVDFGSLISKLTCSTQIAICRLFALLVAL